MQRANDRGTTFVHQFIRTNLSPVGMNPCLTGGSLTGTTREYLLQHSHICLAYSYIRHVAFSVSRFKSYLPHISSQEILQPMDSSLCGESMCTPLSHYLCFISLYHTCVHALCQDSFCFLSSFDIARFPILKKCQLDWHLRA